jgi:uncharacterized repeat protein (TIGR03803 family)
MNRPNLFTTTIVPLPTLISWPPLRHGFVLIAPAIALAWRLGASLLVGIGLVFCTGGIASAEDGEGGFNQPGNILITDQFNNRVMIELTGFRCNNNTNACPNGEFPLALIQASDGNYYGVTNFSGPGSVAMGNVFKVTPDGRLSVIYTFLPDLQGHYPHGADPSSLVEGEDGFLYGTASGGGARGQGIVFKLSKEGAIRILHTFCSDAHCTDGHFPVGLILAHDGDFYGGTQALSSPSVAVVFRITPGGSFTVLHRFDIATEGPGLLGMIQASDGNVYGTTVGQMTRKTVLFRLTPDGQFNVLQTFEFPQFATSAPSEASNGKLYGGLSQFENEQRPGIFEFSLPGVGFRELAPESLFGDLVDDLIQASDGNLWGTAFSSSDNGRVISLSLQGQTLRSIAFNGRNGSSPVSLFQSSDGKIVGITALGGAVSQNETGGGVVFTLDAGLPPRRP